MTPDEELAYHYFLTAMVARDLGLEPGCDDEALAYALARELGLHAGFRGPGLVAGIQRRWPQFEFTLDYVALGTVAIFGSIYNAGHGKHILAVRSDIAEEARDRTIYHEVKHALRGEALPHAELTVLHDDGVLSPIEIGAERFARVMHRLSAGDLSSTLPLDATARAPRGVRQFRALRARRDG